MTDTQFETIEIPGGSQALERSETVVIVVDGERARLPRRACGPRFTRPIGAALTALWLRLIYLSPAAVAAGSHKDIDARVPVVLVGSASPG